MINGDGQTVTSSFKVTFTPPSDRPFINPIPDITIVAGSVASIPLVYGNVGLALNELQVTFQSSDANLVPVSNMKLLGTNLFIAPAGVLVDSSLITVTVINPTNLTADTSFALTVVPSSSPVFANTNTLFTNDNSPGTPYPSSINVSGLGATITDVTVRIGGLSHSFPSDISILLVGPQGQSAVLMGRAGGSAAITNTWLTFDDSASTDLPQNSFIADGRYKPTDYKASDAFFSPAPVAPFGHYLSVFDGTNPNGTWSLYVQDDQPPDSGLITGGWVLAFVTAHIGPASIGPQTTAENTSITVPFTVSASGRSASNLIVTASHTGDVPPGLVSNLTLGGFGSSRTLTITPALNLPSLVVNVDGTSTITLSVTDGTLTNTESFPLTVKFVDQPPNVTGLSDQTTAANVPLTMNFTVTDVDTPISNVLVYATVSDPSLSTVIVMGSGGDRTLTYIPAGVPGINLVSVTANDGLVKTTNNLTVVVTEPISIMVSPIPDMITNEAASAFSVVVVFAVDPGPGGATNLQVSAVADNTNLVTSLLISSNSTFYTLTAAIAPSTTGVSLITIFVRGEYGLGMSRFTLTVLPPAQPPPLLSITRAGNLLKIRFVGARPADLCVLQNTVDFKAWADAATATADGSGGADFEVDPAPASSSEFYRVLVE